jgi:hypothetical protein
MTTKKFSLILGLFVVVLTAQAQTSKEWKDSSLIPPSRLAQHNEFLNNQYDFPAKPRSQWELGFKVGSPSILGEVSTVLPGFGWGLHLRKSLGYLISIRGEFMSSSTKGLNWQEAYSYMKNPAWAANGYNGYQRQGNGQLTPASPDRVFYNHKTKLSELSGQVLFSLTNIRFHKAKNNLNLYAIAGLSMVMYDVKVDALNASGQKYNFNSIPNGTSDTRKDTRSSLKSLLDGTYETAGQPGGRGRAFGRDVAFGPTLGAGAAFKLSNKINLVIEDRLTFTNTDVLDGQKWSFAPVGDPSLNGSNDFYNYLSLGLNINIF